MSLYVQDGYASHDKQVSKHRPILWESASPHSFASLCSTISYTIGIDASGIAFVWGKWKFGDDTNYGIQTIPSIPDIPAIQASCSPRLAALLLADGSVFAWGIDFTAMPSCLCAPGAALAICAGVKSLAVWGKVGLVIYSSVTASLTVQVSEPQIAMLAPLRDSFAVLLENGDLCSLKKLGSSLSFCFPRRDGLHYVTSFFGYRVRYIKCRFGIFLLVTDEGIVFIANSDSSIFAPVQIPQKFVNDPLVCVEIADGRLYFVTASGKLHSYITAKLFAAPGDRMAWVHLRHNELDVTEVSAASDKLFLRVGGSKPPPIPATVTPASLVGRTAPIHISVDSGILQVDPSGASAFGFMPGDIVRYGDQICAVVGAVGNSLVVMDCARRTFIEIEAETRTDLMFHVPLIGRLGANLAEYDLGHGRKLIVDRSVTILAAISSFRAGDIVLHPCLGRGEVLGARLGCLVLRYKCGIRIARPRTHEALMLCHTLTHRDSSMTIQVPTVSGAWLLVDQMPFDRIDPGSIVWSTKHGLGQFLGRVQDRLVVSFLRDGGAARLIPPRRIASVVRSKQSSYSGYLGINQAPITVDAIESAAASLGCLPGDILRIGRQCAVCLGTTRIGDQRSLVFETDDMLLSNLGVGVFGIGRMGNGELLARVAMAWKRRMKMATGETVDLSINTSDFINLPVLPLDRIMAGGRIGLVVGVADGRAYVRFEGDEHVGLLPEDWVLLFRRLPVPTSRTIAGVRVALHAEAYRGFVFLPGDRVEQDSEEFTVLGRVTKRVFLVREVSTGEESQRELAPCGMAAARILHRPAFFD
jgi:hypothetical protein